MTDDDLFGRTLPRADVARITCMVCRRYEHADRARPALCEHCGRDVEATSMHIASVLLSTEGRIQRTYDTFHAAVEAAPPDVRTRWDAYDAARIDGDARAAQVEALARSGRADALLDLVRLWLDYQDAGDHYADTTAWVRRCEEALR